MGDTAVDFFLETLKEIPLLLISFWSSNLDVIIGKKRQLQSLEKEIKYLRGFLKVTEKKRNEHSQVMELVNQIRDVISEAENIVESFVLLSFKDDFACRSKRYDYDSYCLLELFKDHDYLFLDLDGVKKEIKTLSTVVKQIYDENMYDINGVAVEKLKHSSTGIGGGSGSSERRNTSKVVKEKVVVGFEEEAKRLIEKLDDNGEGKPLEIVVVIGTGGGGKTTLAGEVYDHPFTSYTFEIRAWVDISQDYDNTMKRDLLIRILERACPEKCEDYEKINEDKLAEKVHKCLKGKKYLIVMDDIWSIEAWNDIQRSFPKEYKGSKVLFTSRQLVRPDNVNCIPHPLALLPKSWSWELLKKKIFGMECCPLELVDIGEQIAEQCKGLPLAIVAIAGILAKEEKTYDVWKDVAKRLSSIIAEENQEHCMEILELSYNHLPLHLKACFLYIGGFPEDKEIHVRELIWLWIAEGFIEQSESGKNLEDVAKDYFLGLIDRSLVMVARKSSLGGIKACRIHDLLRIFCLKKAEKDNFLVKIYEDASFSPEASTSVTNKHRRLFIGSQFFRKFSSRSHAQNLQNLHSFLCLGLPYSSHLRFQQSMSFFVDNFKLLRVLSFISVAYAGIIDIGDLVHLRYLALHAPRYSSDGYSLDLPFSYLMNLETLNLHSSLPDFFDLPREIYKMVKLRHLYTKNGVFKEHLGRRYIGQYSSSKLESLQTLHRICSCKNCQKFLVTTTPNLRKLGVYGKLMSKDGVLMLPNLEFLKCLETLSFTNDRFSGTRTPSTLPLGLKLPLTITRLALKDTYLKWEELSILQTLPSLEVLKLDDACRGPVWNTCEDGFSQLKFLRLHNMDIEKWNASADQFRGLELLALRGCKKLEGIPIDFANLSELHEIKMEHCSRSATESAREIQEEQKNIRGDDDCLNLIARANLF